MRFYTREDISGFETIRFLYIKTVVNGPVFRITLNRPEKRNAFTPTMANEITFALAYAHYTTDIRCVILSAEGPVFCAGADLNAFHDSAQDRVNPELPLPLKEIILGDAFRELCKPCIAQVEGPVYAGGFLLICGATFVVSSQKATFSLPEVKRGIWPMQVMASLLKIMPPRKVLEISVTGRVYTADEALEMGLVTQIATQDKIVKEVESLADEICENAPYAIHAGMKAFQELPGIPESQWHTYLKDQLDKILESEDSVEGITAFREKRKPVWRGR